MKILLISSNSSGAGGGEQYLVYLAKGLKAEKQEVVVLLSNKTYMDIWGEKLRTENIAVRRENLIGLRDRPLRIFQSTRDKNQIARIASLCEEIKPDIIHVNQQYDADGLDYIMGALAYGKTPVVGTIHMPMTLTKHPRGKREIRTWIINVLLLDKVKSLFLGYWYKKYNYTKMLVSRAMREEFVTAYGRNQSLSLVTYGIDIDHIPYIGDEKKYKVIGFCGRFDPQKEPFLLIDAWLDTRGKGLDCKLLLIGDGILRKDLETQLRDKAPKDSWKITGWVEDSQVYLKDIGLLILTSYFEGFPLVVIEASCMGKPCLCTNFSVASELKEKIPFITVVNSRDPGVLGDAIIEVFRKGAPAKEEVEKVRDYFSCKRMAQDTLSVYRELLRNE